MPDIIFYLCLISFVESVTCKRMVDLKSGHFLILLANCVKNAKIEVIKSGTMSRRPFTTLWRRAGPFVKVDTLLNFNLSEC